MIKDDDILVCEYPNEVESKLKPNHKVVLIGSSMSGKAFSHLFANRDSVISLESSKARQDRFRDVLYEIPEITQTKMWMDPHEVYPGQSKHRNQKAYRYKKRAGKRYGKLKNKKR